MKFEKLKKKLKTFIEDQNPFDDKPPSWLDKPVYSGKQTSEDKVKDMKIELPKKKKKK